MKIGLYPMVADVMHVGHVIAIEEAKKHCDYLIVALYCTPHRKNPVQTIYERYMQLRGLKWIDEIIPYGDENDACTMISSLQYDVYFLGEDYRNKSWEGSDILNKLGKEIYFLPRQHSLSSSDLKNKIITQYLAKESNGQETKNE